VDIPVQRNDGRPDPPGKPYWTLEREPPFDQEWGAPRFHLKGDADREAARLAALDGEQ
jgi:hypothetical protein